MLLLVLATVGKGANMAPVRQLWAGTITMVRGIDTDAALNVTISLVDPGRGTAVAEWTYDHDNSGAPCLSHTETGLVYTEYSDGRVGMEGSGNKAAFYSLVGMRTNGGTAMYGNVTAANAIKGTFILKLDAPQVPSRCTPPPTAPPPTPPIPATTANSTVWPMPALFVRNGAAALWVDPATFTLVAAPGAASPALAAAFDRFTAAAFQHHATTPPASAVAAITQLVVHVRLPFAPLAFEVNESYTLTLTGTTGTIKAETVFGAYHALETMTQLLRFDFAAERYRIQGVPLQITDTPRFAWRELMVDTSRHFLPMTMLHTVVDSMMTAKFNVLHVHWVDSQAFPLVLPSAPKLSTGAWSPEQRYSLADIRELQEYAEARGIRVVAEIDTPGHGGSWCTGMPEICPSITCLEPLDVSSNATFDTIKAVLVDLFSVLPDAFVHLGGDEVETGCWQHTERIATWMNHSGLTPDGAYGHFVRRTQAIAQSLGKTAIVWDEIWNHFSTSLNRSSTVINTRFNPNQAPKRVMCVANATGHGYRVIRSENIHWYLDQTVHKPWTVQYSFDLCGDLDPARCKFIVGGAASMWGETVGPSDFMQTIWPRAGAVGERLWSPESVNDSVAALPRYTQFRCYLNRRGFVAAPALNPEARQGPPRPGSCFTQ